MDGALHLVKAARKSGKPQTLAMIKAALKVAHTTGNRRSAGLWLLGVVRGPRRDKPKTVLIRCNKCNREDIDVLPTFASRTGKYVARPRRCHDCSGSLQDYLPVEEMPCGHIRHSALSDRLKTTTGCELYYGKSSVPLDPGANPGANPDYARELVDAVPSQDHRGLSALEYGLFRMKNFTDGILRLADTTKGEPESVTLKCAILSCGATRLDKRLFFLSYTGEHVSTKVKCPGPGCTSSSTGYTAQTSWIPVDVEALPKAFNTTTR